MACHSYLEAQKDVANAYRKQDSQDQEAYKDTERQVYEEYVTVMSQISCECLANKATATSY